MFLSLHVFIQEKGNRIWYLTHKFWSPPKNWGYTHMAQLLHDRNFILFFQLVMIIWVLYVDPTNSLTWPQKKHKTSLLWHHNLTFITRYIRICVCSALVILLANTKVKIRKSFHRKHKFLNQHIHKRMETEFNIWQF